MHNAKAIADALKEVARLLQIRGDSIYRVRAYHQAALVLEAHADELPTRMVNGTLSELEYVGPTTERLARELWETGRSDYLDQLRDEIPPGVVRLAGLPGVGPRKAMTLFTELRISSPEELVVACRTNRVRGLKGFGEKTQTRLLEAALRAMRKQDQPEQQLPLPLDRAQPSA